MKPNLIHYICARPQIVACSLGAIALNVCFHRADFSGDFLFFVITDAFVTLCLIVSLVANVCLGMFGGMLLFWPFLRPLFSKINASSISIGDKVMVLSGPNKGMIGQVCEFVIGQGGWRLARIDFGVDLGGIKVFEIYSVFKFRKHSQ